MVPAPPPVHGRRLRVAGVALGRFPMVDGRPQDPDWYAAFLVARFVPDTVPILSRHGGIAAGYLDTLEADGPDLRFGGWIVDYPDIVSRLRRACGVSIETAFGAVPLLGGGHYLPRSTIHRLRQGTEPSHYLGTYREGDQLVGVALSDNPAAPGSCAWIVDTYTPDPE